jgi:hypothetical protein
MIHRLTFLAYALTALSLAACGDLNVADGELSRVTYALHSDYLTENVALTEVSLITGHVQPISTGLTLEGRTVAGDKAALIEHVATPGSGVEITHHASFSNHEIRSFDLEVTTPGTITVAGLLDGEVFDQIQLTFDTPSDLELVTRTRAPYSDDWEDLDDDETLVAEGSQVAFLPIPLDASGARLAGNFEVDVQAEPSWAVSPSWNVLGVYEQSIIGSPSPVSLYFIEPGLVTVTLTDLANGVSATRHFEVLPVEGD